MFLIVLAIVLGYVEAQIPPLHCCGPQQWEGHSDLVLGIVGETQTDAILVSDSLPFKLPVSPLTIIVLANTTASEHGNR